MTLPVIQNEMLTANAGSGKTYALTTRIIHLLLAGESPDRIAALTFTRKSAGEFLDNLLQRIATAALNPDALKALAKDLDYPELTADACRHLLADLINHFGRLGLGTIDSFFARMARHFPLETGLPEDFAIADAAALDAARERALASRFAQTAKDSEALKAMVTQFRQISRKDGERNVFQSLLNQINELHNRFIETPASICWGDGAAIWGTTGVPFANANTIEHGVQAFKNAVLGNQTKLSPEAWNILDDHFDALLQLRPDSPLSKPVKNFISRLSNEPKNGHLQITKRKTGWLELSEPVRQARAELIGSVLKFEFEKLLTRTRGIYDFMESYEGTYAKEVRGAGLITFSDITELLAERAAIENTSEAADQWRNRVAYRIDQEFDHWLLDEFQDTSRTQWRILQAFIEEVLMDASRDRSFFYVGDTKQAIYGWRGGESDLFHEIHAHYEDAFGKTAPLATSWRSAPPIIELVNAVFEKIETVAASLNLSDAVVKKWNAGWNVHKVAKPNKERIGYAQWLTVDDATEDSPFPLFDAVTEILNAVDPIERGISCAILLRQNKDIETLAAELQASGFPVAVEGNTNPCLDNPLGSAVLAVLKAVAFPGDALALKIANGYPVAEQWGLHDFENFREKTLSALINQGYAEVIKTWIQSAELNTTEPFLAERAFALIAAASDYDATKTSSDGIAGFISKLETRQVQEAEASGVIRLMTVHQAKGLGFDMTIVAGLDKRSPNRTADTLALGPNKKDPKWGLLMPSKIIAEKDPLLNSLLAEKNDETAYSDLCTAYVALTRPKYALYAITTELPEKTTSKHFGRLMRDTFEAAPWEAGDPKWFEAYKCKADPTPATETTSSPEFAPNFHRLPIPQSPTQSNDSQSFATDAIERGNQMHAAFAEIEWLNPTATESPLDLETPPEILKTLQQCLKGDDLRTLLTAPPYPTKVWRERSFEVTLNNQWFSGTFDRVHLHYEDGETLSRVELIDFKTDSLAYESEIPACLRRHQQQIERYREALQQITGLPKEKVHASLYLTALAKRASYDPSTGSC